MKTITRQVGTTSRGFTIVELLIVVVVIAILAAITIVAYNGVTNRAKASAAQTAAENATKKVLIYKVDNSDTPPASLADIGLTNDGSTQYQYTAIGTGYCLTATTSGSSAYTANNYTYNGGTTVNQAAPVAGACPGHSTTGGTVVKNLVTNPSFENDTTGWQTSNANIAISTTWQNTGVSSLRVVNTGTSNSGDVRTTSTANTFPFGMQAGKTYTISAKLYFTVAPTGGLGRAPGILYWYSTNGSSWTESFGPKASTTPGTQTVSYTITIPSDATGILIGFGVASTTASQSFYYDTITIVEGSTVYQPADGLSTNWVWLGTPNASASSGPGTI